MASSKLTISSAHPLIDGCSKGNYEQRETSSPQPQDSSRKICLRLCGPFWFIFPNAREDDGESCIDSHTRPRDLGTVLHLKGHLQERNCPQMRWKLTQPSTLLLLSRNCIVLCYLLENYEYKIKALSTHLHPLSHNLLKCFAVRFLAKVMIELPFFILWDCHDLKFWLVLGVDLPFRFQDPAMSECTASSAVQGRTWNDDPLQITGDSVDRHLIQTGSRLLLKWIMKGNECG